MARELHEAAVEDISNNKALRKLAREVQASGQPRVLRENGVDVAKVVPLKPKKARPSTPADADPFLASFGGWKGNVDVEQFLKENDRSRNVPGRPPVELEF